MGNDDGKDRYVHPFERSATKLRTSKEEFPNIDNPDEVPGGRIPSTGRGNSEDGSEWLNPTPAELFRALRRKDKHIEVGIKSSWLMHLFNAVYYCCTCRHCANMHIPHNSPDHSALFCFLFFSFFFFLFPSSLFFVLFFSLLSYH